MKLKDYKWRLIIKGKEGKEGFYCLIRKTLASGVNGIAKVPKFLPKWD